MSQTYPPAAAATSLPRLVSLGAWAAFTLVAGSFVASFGSNAPYADEWEFVPAALGHEPALPWLWAQHNEHRLPLPRAIFLAYFRPTHDFRTGMYLQVGMVSALALGMILLAAKLRGRPHWADVFFPVSLLHLGHWENFLMGYQVCFALFCVLATAIGVVALRTTPETRFRSGGIAGVLGFLAALTGGSGLVLALPVAAWVAYLGAGLWRTGAKGKAAALLALALLPLVYLAVYFVGYQRPPHHPKPGDGGLNVLKVTGQTLAMGFGIGLFLAWAAVLLGTLALGVLTLREVWKTLPRPAAVGLTAVAAGVAGVAAAIGVGRGGLGDEMGLWARYSFLMWPLLGLSCLVWVRHKWVPMMLCLVAALAFPGNMLTGLSIGTKVKETLSLIEDESQRGTPPEKIVEKFKGTTQANQEERAVRGIPMLQAAGIGRFARR